MSPTKKRNRNTSHSSKLDKALSIFSIGQLNHTKKKHANSYPPIDDDESEIFHLALYVVKLLLISCTVAFLLGFVVILNKNNEGKIIILGLLSALGLVSFPSLFGFGMIKQRVGITVKRISDREKRKNDPGNYFYESSTQDLRQKQYLYRISGAEGPSIHVSKLNLSGNAISHRLKDKFSDRKEYPFDLQKEWQEEIERRKVSCILSNLSDDEFFGSISTIATLHVFHLSRSEENRKKIENGTEYQFWLDLYIYMKAWLICSVDSYDETSMPIQVIGLNYPSENMPDKALYKRAFTYIRKDVLTHENALKQLQYNQLAVEKLQRGLKKLIEHIDEYVY